MTAMRAANPADLATPGLYRANQLTILLHNVGSLTLAAGRTRREILKMSEFSTPGRVIPWWTAVRNVKGVFLYG